LTIEQPPDKIMSQVLAILQEDVYFRSPLYAD